MALQVLLHQRLTRWCRVIRSGLPECWVLCSRCKDVVSSHHVRPGVIDALGAEVLVYVCTDADTCTARTIERGAVAIVVAKLKRRKKR